MSDPLPWLGKGIKIFGAVMIVACAAALIWSLTRPAITHGPMPEPTPLAKTPDAGDKDAR